ncbi:hypothetical protein F3J45_24750 [Pantoea sp. Ap-967]|uniref:hypothetical protein n=1 Tax=Pantoea sp. Ap-967 TaxID=2608362 RepID=UPI0014213AED|nr:hypothetical protein [Pantoea sp. Ap-967]NIE77646.1 hypothetical protein [Pantoea sp. Ap-967]
MHNKSENKVSHFVLGACILLFLIFKFSRYIQTSSFDLVQHLLLVDELSRHARVLPEAFDRIGAMALYPPVSHWLATLVGWVGGSGLVGISIVSIIAVFLCYILIVCLLEIKSAARIIAASAVFSALMLTHSLVGWEIVVNYFYPQLVADVVYFGVLLWVLKNRQNWQQTVAFLLAGYVTMWIQPLVAVHVLASGCALMTFLLWNRWSEGKRIRLESAANLFVIVVGAAVIVFTNPALKVMRQISANDGYLVFGYPAAVPVAFLCGLIGAWSLRNYWKNKGDYADLIIGSATLAAVGLVFIQYALLKLHGDGSDYAIKKHMFIVVTLGMMNVIRLLTPATNKHTRNIPTSLVAPLLAGVASVFALQGFTTRVAPIVDALSYANNMAEYQLPDFEPGNLIYDDGSLPLMGNVMVTLTAFQHPFNDRAISWLRGAPIKAGAELVMIPRTSNVDTACNSKVSETRNFVVVRQSCLSNYIPGYELTFRPGGSAWQYTTDGWGGAEAWGAWSLGDTGGALKLQLPNASYTLEVDGMAYLTPQHPEQTIIVEANGTEIAQWTFDQGSPSGTRSAAIPKNLTADGSVQLVFKAPGSVSPQQLGQSADARVLGLGVSKLTVRTAP